MAALIALTASLARVPPRRVTFHRAIDVARDYDAALEVSAPLRVERRLSELPE